MELPFELSFGLIVGPTYWWWCELISQFIGNLFGDWLGLVSETDALVGRVVRFFCRLGP